ncbi:HdeD family acid-resistance protein [Streptomyces sp. UH6]|uniref:HdeD family acid-resistance protein n=1 Tax=Streptomyces sp. UH6 TaxID=2748379 RepID=UPI0015D48F5E|nr:HdeD family acid-resistance protein [Streptomyces sp. UH6]NYV76492.1 HdeD family acid-resistance protein [Streptomyces sp. UH6]
MSGIRAKDERARINRSFGWLAALGVALVIAGIVGLVYTGVATLTTMLLFGWLLLIGGVVGLLHAVQARGTGFFWLGVVVAALNIAAGVVILVRPDVAAVSLTLFAALLFLTGGVFRVVGSLVVRGPQFGWTLVQGAFGLLLGILVLNSWPSDSRYVLGTFFSLALLFDGLGLIATGFGGRNVVGMVTEADRSDRTHRTDRTLGGDAYYAGRSDAERNVDAGERTGPGREERRGQGDVPPQ